MDYTKLIDIAAYTLPALITAGVSYFFFQKHTENEENRRNYLLLKESRKEVLPLKIQAYERMALFLERTNPIKLVLRVAPQGADKNAYENLLIQTIEQEFEHNLTQQIYISDACWEIINKAKNAVIQNIRWTTTQVENAQELRERILTDLASEKDVPNVIALSYLKTEIQHYL